jgi:DNA topoisomerase-3
MESTAWDMLAYVHNVFQFELYEEPQIIQVLNNSKVSDHHAIIPTAEIAKQDLSTLSQGEQDILLLISQRLLCATAGKQRISETEVKVECAGEEFTAKGKMILEKGWKAIEDDFRGRLKNKKKQEPKDTILPEVFEGQVFSAVKAALSEHYTTPPKAYTEDTLLSAMETAGNDSFEEDTEKKGLGTPATRASMIEKLVQSKYVVRKGKQLVPTEAGMKLAEILPEEIKSPKLTAEWENTLMQMERGQVLPGQFMSDIVEMVSDLVGKYDELSEEEKKRFGFTKEKEQIGICPRCGSPVYEGGKNFYCSNRECSFCLWKEPKFLSGMKKKLSKKMASSLLKDGRVKATGLYSQKTGRNFDAVLVMEDTGQYVNFKLEFDNNKK